MNPSIAAAVTALTDGRLVLFVDNSLPSPVSYLLGRGDTLSEAQVSFMVNVGRAVLLAAVSEERIKELGLPMMVRRTDEGSPDFVVSVEARQGVSTGISSADRAQTVRTLATTRDAKRELIAPGHIFPIRAKTGGVLVRVTIAEGAIDLLTLCGLSPVAALMHMLGSDGAYLPEAGALEVARTHSVPVVYLSDVVRHRLATEQIVEEIANAELPTQVAGDFRARCFRSLNDGAEHLALVKGELPSIEAQEAGASVLVRVQTEDRIGDLLGSDNLRGRKNIAKSMKAIEREGAGVLVYVRHPRRGMLRDQVQRLASGESKPRAPMELREFGVGAQILSRLGIQKIRLLTNVNREITGLEAFKLEIVDRVPF